MQCPKHGCPLQSLHHKHPLFARTAHQLQQSGMGLGKAAALLSQRTVVPLPNEWLEAFWCQECMATSWYHVKKSGNAYHLLAASRGIWSQACGVVDVRGHITASEFTLRQARKLSVVDR